jgi:hypothetical protein
MVPGPTGFIAMFSLPHHSRGLQISQLVPSDGRSLRRVASDSMEVICGCKSHRNQ